MFIRHLLFSSIVLGARNMSVKKQTKTFALMKLRFLVNYFDVHKFNKMEVNKNKIYKTKHQ